MIPDDPDYAWPASMLRSLDAALSKREGVGTGAGEGATGQDTGTARVTRSVDCPEDPAQDHPLSEREVQR